MKLLKQLSYLFLPVLFLSTGISSAYELDLVAVSGDGSDTPESLFSLDPATGTETFLMNLGNGNDGETIAFNPADGLLYHSSGIADGDRFWESINVNAMNIVSSVQFMGADVDDENFAMVYNPATG